MISRTKYYTGALLFPYVVLLFAVAVLGAAREWTAVDRTIAPIVQVAGLIVAGSVIAVIPYTILAIAVFLRTRRDAITDYTVKGYLLAMPLLVAAVVFAVAVVRGVLKQSPSEGVGLGVVLGLFCLVIGYLYEAIIVFAAFALRVPRFDPNKNG